MGKEESSIDPDALADKMSDVTMEIVIGNVKKEEDLYQLIEKNFTPREITHVAAIYLAEKTEKFLKENSMLRYLVKMAREGVQEEANLKAIKDLLNKK